MRVRACTSRLTEDHNHDDPDDLLTQRLRPGDPDDDRDDDLDAKEISS